MDSAGIRRILIVKLSALGDVVHALPVIGYLAKAAPDASIDWAVDRRFASLLEGNPRLRRVVPLDLRTWKGRWAAPETGRRAAAAVRDLREGRYDVAFDIQGNVKSGVVTRLSGAPLRFGFDRRGVREAPNLLFTNRKVPSRPEDIHVTQKLLRVVAAPFGRTVESGESLPALVVRRDELDAAARTVRTLLPDAFPVLAVHPGTTWETKKMNLRFWTETILLLRRKFPGLGVLLSWGTEGEREEAEAIREKTGGQVLAAPRQSLREIAALYKACGYFLGPDTGPLHIAAAVGARTVSVFRATDGRRNAPRGPGHRFLQAPLPCTACLRKRCDRDAVCRETLRPEDAAAWMAERMAEGKERSRN